MINGVAKLYFLVALKKSQEALEIIKKETDVTKKWYNLGQLESVVLVAEKMWEEMKK